LLHCLLFLFITICIGLLLFYAQLSNCSPTPRREQLIYRQDDDEVRFVVGQHAQLDFYSASSLKQHPAGKHVAPLVHILLIRRQSDNAITP